MDTNQTESETVSSCVIVKCSVCAVPLHIVMLMLHLCFLIIRLIAWHLRFMSSKPDTLRLDRRETEINTLPFLCPLRVIHGKQMISTYSGTNSHVIVVQEITTNTCHVLWQFELSNAGMQWKKRNVYWVNNVVVGRLFAELTLDKHSRLSLNHKTTHTHMERERTGCAHLTMHFIYSHWPKCSHIHTHTQCWEAAALSWI